MTVLKDKHGKPVTKQRALEAAVESLTSGWRRGSDVGPEATAWALIAQQVDGSGTIVGTHHEP